MTTERTKNINYIGVGYFVVALLFGLAGGYFGQPWIHENERAVNVIVTVFSILAGFLVAIMTIVGDPGLFGRKTWREHELQRKAIFGRLAKQKWLFMLYLATLGTVFAESLMSKGFPTLAALSIWMERIYLGMAITAFLLSLRLPGALMRIQLERHDQLIEQRRGSSNRGKQADP